MNDELITLIQKNKVTLVVTEDHFGKELHQKLLSNSSRHVLYMNICDAESVLEILPDKKYLLIMEGFGEDDRFENIHIRYQLINLDLQVVVICKPSVLKQCHDPALFFAPIKNGRLQKKMMAKYEMAVSVNSPVPLKILRPEEAKPTEVKKHSVKNEYFLSKKLMTRDALVMQMVADRVVGSEGYKNFLFGLVYASRTDKAMQVTAANAITALNYARVSFSGMDLSGIEVPEADLSYALFDAAVLSRGNLTNVNLKQVYLGNADLSFCKMDGVSFSQLKDKVFESAVRCFAWSNNGKWLALAFDDHSISVVDSVSLKEIYSFKDHNEHICNVQFRGDDRYLASASWDETSRIWDITTGKLKHVFRTANTRCQDVQFDPSGKYLISAWGQDGSIRFYDIETGAETHKLCDDYVFDVEHIRITPNGHWLVSAQTDSIVVWDLEHSKIAAILWEHQTGACAVTAVDISEDGNYFAAVHADKTIYLWDLSFLKDLGSEVCTNETPVIDIATNSLVVKENYPSFIFTPSAFNFDSNFRLDFTASIADFNKSRDIASSNLARDLAALNSNLTRNISAKLGWEGIPRFISRTSLEGHLDEVTSMQFSRDNPYLISVSKDLTVRVWDIHEKKERQIFVGSKTQIYYAQERPDKKYVAFSGIDKILHFFELSQAGSEFLPIAQTSQIRIIKSSVNSSLIASGSSDGMVCIWDTRIGGAVKKIHGHDNIISALAFSDDDKYIASGSWDKTIQVWDVITGRRIQQFNYPDPPSHRDMGTYITNLLFSPDGKLLITTTNWNNDIYLWDMVTGRVKAILRGHKSYISNIAFNPDGKYLASFSYIDQRVFLWDMISFKQLFEIEDMNLTEVTLQFIPKTNNLIISGEDKNNYTHFVILFRLNFDKCRVIKKEILLRGYITNFKISNNGKKFSYISCDDVKIGGTQYWSVEYVIKGGDGQINCMDFNYNSTQIITGTDDGLMKIWGLEETKKGVNNAVLVWRSYPALFAKGCNIEDVSELSADNRELLESLDVITTTNTNDFVLKN